MMYNKWGPLFDVVIGLCCGHLLFLGIIGKAPTAILGILILLCHVARITIQDD